MFIGPVFSRELVTSARRRRLYASRSIYLTLLLVLACTAWLVLSGSHVVRGIGDMARFGAVLLQVLAPLQLALAIFFSALLIASAVAQEKDRQTLVLLLMTHLSNRELVLGKLAASLLNVLVMFIAALPLFLLVVLLGGVSFDQVGRIYVVTFAAALLAASLGSTIALWREKTFQTLALTSLVIVFWLSGGEIIAGGALGEQWWGISTESWAVAASPVRALAAASQPSWCAGPRLAGFPLPAAAFVLAAFASAAAVNGIAIARVRVWNPSRQIHSQAKTSGSPLKKCATALLSSSAVSKPLQNTAGQGSSGTRIAEGHEQPFQSTSTGADRLVAHPTEKTSRQVWDNPILWREMATWAYGRKVLLIRGVYLLLALGIAFATVSASTALAASDEAQFTRPGAAVPLATLFIVSLMLVGAMSVTSITTERDSRCLDLLLVTDLTAKEIVFGKLGGTLYNTKEMILLPMALCAYLGYAGVTSFENVGYLIGGLIVLNLFVAMLGLHCGMIHANSRVAVAVSLGTLFFLLVGIATCIALLIAFSDPFGESFQVQIAPFLAFMIGGSAGIYVAIGAKSPSSAVFWASLICPLATFWAITSYFLDFSLGIFLVTLVTYGFATLSMLIPSIAEFDVTTGRTTGGEG